jgi:hypothetical protein
MPCAACCKAQDEGAKSGVYYKQTNQTPTHKQQRKTKIPKKTTPSSVKAPVWRMRSLQFGVST